MRATPVTRGGSAHHVWGREFDPDRLALLELRAWKAYYRRQPLRLFALLVMVYREQAGVSWWRAVLAAYFLARAASGFGRATGDYARRSANLCSG